MTIHAHAPDDRDPYKILEVSVKATVADITKKYRALARKYHTDGKSGNEEKIRDLNWAYELLTVPGMLKEHEQQQVLAKVAADVRRREEARRQRAKERSVEQAKIVGDQFRGEATEGPGGPPPTRPESPPNATSAPPPRSPPPPSQPTSTPQRSRQFDFIGWIGGSVLCSIVMLVPDIWISVWIRAIAIGGSAGFNFEFYIILSCIFGVIGSTIFSLKES